MAAETTFVFEPVRYLTRQPIDSPRRFREKEAMLLRRRRERESTYFFDRVIRQNKENFESILVRQEIRRVIKENTNRMSTQIREKMERVIPFVDVIERLAPSAENITSSLIIDYDLPSEYYFYTGNPSIVLPMSANSFCILSRTKEEAAQLMQFIRTEFEKLNEVTKDFGLELLDFLTGRKYQETILKSLRNIQSVQYAEPRNDFEKEVIDTCEKMTSSFLPNPEILFSEPTETYEVDVFVGINEEVKKIIEPTNYETLKEMPAGENLKSQVILRTLDKAQRLGAQSVVIAKGFPEQAFNELKKIADSRGVTLLSDSNYKNQLHKVLCEDLLKSYMEPPTVRYIVR